MTKKDFNTLLAILFGGAVVFGGLLAWAEKANHISNTDVNFGITMRSVATLQIGGDK